VNTNPKNPIFIVITGHAFYSVPIATGCSNSLQYLIKMARSLLFVRLPDK
jgi:hypothetical protein